jgi:hypothetical protein
MIATVVFQFHSDNQDRKSPYLIGVILVVFVILRPVFYITVGSDWIPERSPSIVDSLNLSNGQVAVSWT